MSTLLFALGFTVPVGVLVLIVLYVRSALTAAPLKGATSSGTESPTCDGVLEDWQELLLPQENLEMLQTVLTRAAHRERERKEKERVLLYWVDETRRPCGDEMISQLEPQLTSKGRPPSKKSPSKKRSTTAKPRSLARPKSKKSTK